MNEEYEIELPGDAVPDDIENYLEKLPQMTVQVRIDQATASFLEYDFFNWSKTRPSVLPPDQRDKINDLLDTADYLRFSCMSPHLKQILWKGVRFYYGLSEQEFPFPDSLKNKRVSVISKKTRDLLPITGIIAVIIFASFVGALIGNTVGTIHSRHDSSYPSEASLLSSPPQPIFGHETADTAERASAEPKQNPTVTASQSQH
ncbi:hypothetical protein [Acidiphilium acidophilum]|uniref:F-box domain-containing protein n=1 Tax=Acidiphilium acidophilum TaxID=76588 RepID=A0AAW9DLR8_ACIAO|nr:hypothetical protein [Acidiphilium acidophilum]MDX5929418.1 hypothetical protein [Acidiphilium acidophilum]MDX5929486.1 hypothetical protein [Acidiphilium acidophilum]